MSLFIHIYIRNALSFVSKGDKSDRNEHRNGSFEMRSVVCACAKRFLIRCLNMSIVGHRRRHRNDADNDACRLIRGQHTHTMLGLFVS